MDQFYREIDQACRAGRLLYSAPLPLEHYYGLEQRTGFRGFIVYKFPNKRIPEVLQIYNPKYGQNIGIIQSDDMDLIKYNHDRQIYIDRNSRIIQYIHENQKGVNTMKLNMNGQLDTLLSSNDQKTRCMYFKNKKPIIGPCQNHKRIIEPRRNKL